MTVETMKRIRLGFANLEVNFVNREQALKLIEVWAGRGTGFPKVIYGPEGCGKTAWLLQSIELLKEFGFEVIYVNPLSNRVIAEFGIRELREEFLKLVREAVNQNALARIAWLALNTVMDLIKLGGGKVAIIVDDAFQVIGVRESAMYVKALLGLIEHPPGHYERIITIAATSEGVSLREIGRHLWSESIPIWNMSKEGFRQLYEQLPEPKPEFEDVWRLTGGNPRMLERLYESGWIADKVINDLVREKMITPNFTRKWASHLREAVEDPDYLWYNAPEELINELIEKNLIMYFLPDRDPGQWIDEPPPERDLELGIGRYVAWQTPLHREAVRRVLGS